MRWRRKATVMRVCASLPSGNTIYKLLQRSVTWRKESSNE